jgi:hypothetical protein
MRQRLRAGPAGWAGVVLLLVGPTAVAAPQGEFYVSEAGNYRIRMPGVPRVQQQALSTAGVPVTMNMATVETPDRRGAHAVSYFAMPAQAARPGTADAILDGGARGMAATTGSVITEQTPVRFGAHPGLDVTTEAPPKGGGEATVTRARLLLVGNRFYQVLLISPKSRSRREDFEAFRDSFSLIRDVPPVAAAGAPGPRPNVSAMPAPMPSRPIGPRSAPAFVGESGPDPSGPAESDIRVDYDASKAIDRIRPGGFNENPFRDIAPAGGVLVGARVGYVDSFGGPKVGSIRPIYQIGSKYVEGELGGNPAAALGEARAVAKPGYIVAGINYRAGLLVDAVQLVFGRVKAGKVDLRDSYLSPWLGDPNGGTLMYVSGEGRFIAGVLGRSNGREINAIGLAVVAGPTNAKVAASPPGAPAAKAATPAVAPIVPRPKPAPAPDSAPRPSPEPALAEVMPKVPARAPAVDPFPILEPPAIDPAVAAAASRRPAPIPLAVPYDETRTSDVPEPDGNPREAFRDVAPRGGVLVGVRVGYTEQFGGDKVGAIQPLYQVGGGYIPGRRFGAVGVRGGVTVMARPGYAVGSINLRQGLIVDAFQLVFQRVEEGRLVPDDSYTSDWIGDPGGGASTASGQGRPVVGLHGRADAGGVQRLGLVVAQ